MTAEQPRGACSCTIPILTWNRQGILLRAQSQFLPRSTISARNLQGKDPQASCTVRQGSFQRGRWQMPHRNTVWPWACLLPNSHTSACLCWITSHLSIPRPVCSLLDVSISQPLPRLTLWQRCARSGRALSSFTQTHSRDVFWLAGWWSSQTHPNDITIQASHFTPGSAGDMAY